MKLTPFIAICALTALVSCSSPEQKHVDADTTAKVLQSATSDPSSGVQDSAMVGLARTYLKTSLKGDLESGALDSLSRRFMVSQFDLNGDGAMEVFVGLNGPYFCGSGGCSWILLDHTGKLISRFTVSEYPIFIADETTTGWKNLIINSGGKDHLLKFAKGKYPGNPSVEPIISIEDKGNLKKVLDITDEKQKWFVL